MQGLQGDLGSISGLGRSSGEGTGYSPQYFWASPVAQTVKNLPVVLETWVRSLGWEDPLEEGMAAHSSIPAWRIPWTEEPGGLQSMGSPRVKHVWATEDRAAQPVYSRIIHIGWEHFVSCPQDPQEETSSETLQLFCSPDSHPQRSRGVSPTLGKSDEACSAPPASSWEPAFHRSHACWPSFNGARSLPAWKAHVNFPSVAEPLTVTKGIFWSLSDWLLLIHPLSVQNSDRRIVNHIERPLQSVKWFLIIYS